MANTTIGYVTCPIMGDEAEVRRDKRRKLYYVGLAGKITPNLIDGQSWLKKMTKFIGENGKPLPKIENDNIYVNEKNETESEPRISVNEKKTVNGGKTLMNFLFKDE